MSRRCAQSIPNPLSRKHTPQRWAGWVFLAFLAGLVGLTSRPAQAALELPNRKDTVLASYKDAKITAEDLATMINNAGYPGEMTWKSLDQLPESTLRQFIEQSVSNRILAREAAQDKDWQPSDDVQENLTQIRQRLLLQQLFRTAILDKVTTPTEEELRAAYEENKDSFKIPFSFVMQHLYLSTYDNYTVQEGDTLESIARKVAGDRSVADEILTKATKRVRAEAIEKGEGEEEPLGPLTPGEELLVPMSKKKEAEVAALIDDIYRQLQEGADFARLAEKYSEAPSGAEEVRITPREDRPMLSEIIDVVKSTPVGSYSEPFKTKHGWQIIKVVERTDESIRAFDSVKTSLQNQLLRQKQQELAQEFVDKVFETADFIKIHLDALKDDAEPMAVLATIEPRIYTRKDFKEDFPDKLSPDLTEKEVRDLIKGIGRLQQAALMLEADKMGLADNPKVKEQMEMAEANVVAQAYLRDQIQEKVKSLPESELKQFYEDTKDRLFKTPRKLDLYVIALPASATQGEEDMTPEEARKKAQDQLTEWKKDIKTLDQFKKLAAEHSVVKPEEGGHVGEVAANAYEGGFRGKLDTVPVGSPAGPFSAQNREFLVWAESETASEYEPFDKIRDRIVDAYTREQGRRIGNEIRQAALDKVDFKLFFGQEPTEGTDEKSQ